MSAPALAKGVRFRRIADGRGIILIPEGMVDLSPSAAAIIELVDGDRTVPAIVRELADRYAVGEVEMARDVETLLQRLADQAWLIFKAREQL